MFTLRRLLCLFFSLLCITFIFVLTVTVIKGRFIIRLVFIIIVELILWSNFKFLVLLWVALFLRVFKFNLLLSKLVKGLFRKIIFWMVYKLNWLLRKLVMEFFLTYNCRFLNFWWSNQRHYRFPFDIFCSRTRCASRSWSACICHFEIIGVYRLLSWLYSSLSLLLAWVDHTLTDDKLRWINHNRRLYRQARVCCTLIDDNLLWWIYHRRRLHRLAMVAHTLIDDKLRWINHNRRLHRQARVYNLGRLRNSYGFNLLVRKLTNLLMMYSSCGNRQIWCISRGRGSSRRQWRWYLHSWQGWWQLLIWQGWW